MKKILLLILLLSSHLFAEDLGHWNWTTFSTKVEDVKLSLLLDNRFRDSFDEHYFRFASLKLEYPIHQNVNIGFNYSLYDLKSKDSEWKDGRRYEFELSPHYTFENKWKVSLRNRLELRKIEDKGSDNTRSRHRFRIDIPIKTDWEAFKGFYASNEFFINYDDSTRWDESRFQPFGLSFQISSQISFSLFYLDQLKRPRGQKSWDSNPNIGTALTINF